MEEESPTRVSNCSYEEGAPCLDFAKEAGLSHTFQDFCGLTKEASDLNDSDAETIKQLGVQFTNVLFSVDTARTS